jgi:ABC-2 type transport system ATP-binding protein
MTPALEVAGVSKVYAGGQVALDGVSLTVEPGQIAGLLGPNGAGKTTLVSIVAGLRRPDAGTVSVCGVDALKSPRVARRRLGVAPQELGVCPILRPRENLRLFAELAGFSRAETSRQIGDLSDALDLGEFLDRPVRFLSGGQQRRVHTALAMIRRPALLLLDEPTAGVDVHTRGDLLELVRELADEGVAVCYSTHYLQEAEALDAAVTILDGGRVIAGGTVAELVARYAEPLVELTFEGSPPQIDLPDRSSVSGDTLRVYGDPPTAVAAHVVTALGSEAERLRSVEIIRPSLESVFLSVTGRRWAIEEPSLVT